MGSHGASPLSPAPHHPRSEEDIRAAQPPLMRAILDSLGLGDWNMYSAEGKDLTSL